MKKTLTLLLGGMMIMGGGAAFASGGKAHWGYSGEEGPAKWASLSPDYAICGSGTSQSPIDISNAVEAELESIVCNYTPVGLDIVNNGHTIKQSCAGGGTMVVEGTTYKLLQFHFHTPSENMINGESFPMEVHLVHADDEGNLAVIGVMFKDGAENPTVAALWEKMPAKASESAAAADVSVNALDLLPENREYYRFDGSLTTPPCSEGVKWFVMKSPVEASAKQMAQFTETMHGPTNRPVQPPNDRIVQQ